MNFRDGEGRNSESKEMCVVREIHAERGEEGGRQIGQAGT